MAVTHDGSLISWPIPCKFDATKNGGPVAIYGKRKYFVDKKEKFIPCCVDMLKDVAPSDFKRLAIASTSLAEVWKSAKPRGIGSSLAKSLSMDDLPAPRIWVHDLWP
ncbi:hypothetical protein MXB_3948 [Myxobolus squamalis]|nr:hypothetical protein MXB_3948 [Myxobolus squamalis]